jgi:hypothetical protein
MKELNEYLEAFSEIIYNLQKESKYENVKIGGSLLLKVHGLNFRKSDDIDVIIYKPNDKQKERLKILKEFRITNHPSDYFDSDNFKIEKNDLIMNIMSVDEEPSEYSLKYKFKNRYFNVVGIDEIIAAKKSYSRKKDLTDFINLKNLNFNI